MNNSIKIHPPSGNVGRRQSSPGNLSARKLKRACFPFFGGKFDVLPEIYARFGNNCTNVIEACGGSGVFSLNFPSISAGGNPVRRLFNDLDSLLVNVMRAFTYGKKAELAKICSSGYHETDLIGWHYELINRRGELKTKLEKNPRYCNLKIAGRYIWGMRGWIGAGFTAPGTNVKNKMPRAAISGWKYGSAMAELNEFESRAEGLQSFCGGWERPLKSPTQLEIGSGYTAIFIDPVYPDWICSGAYAFNDPLVCKYSRDRAIMLGESSRCRVAWCGYYSFFDEFFPPDWERFFWNTQGGYGNQADEGRGRVNSADECIWFSPACLKPGTSPANSVARLI